MASLDITRSSHGATGVFRSVGVWFTAAFAAVEAWRDARETRKGLSGLSARELADIGLTRAEIDAL